MQAVKFKDDKDMELFFSLNIILIMVFSDLAYYAKKKHGVILTITETLTNKEEDQALNRQSDAHQKAIALDIRANDMPKEITRDLCDYINNKKDFEEFHYMAQSGKRRLAYDHGKEKNYHIHLQIHQKFSGQK